MKKFLSLLYFKTFDRLNSRLDIVEKRINEREDKLEKITHTMAQIYKEMKFKRS